jgi:hypothetical protein
LDFYSEYCVFENALVYRFTENVGNIPKIKSPNIEKKIKFKFILYRLVICSVLAGTVPVFGVCPGIPDFHQTVPV